MIAALVVAPRYGAHAHELIRPRSTGACYLIRAPVQSTADLGVSGEELCRLSPNLDRPSELQPQGLELLGVDAEYVRQAMPTKFRNLAHVRAVGQRSRHCRRDLARDDPQVCLESIA